MIAVDTKLLVYARRAENLFHAAAAQLARTMKHRADRDFSRYPALRVRNPLI